MFSTAPRRTFSASYTVHADVAQLVAHNLAKVGVAGSNPVVRSRGWTQPSRWSGRVVRQRPAKPCTRVRFPSPPRAISSAGERFPDTEEVTGSIPVSRTEIDARCSTVCTCSTSDGPQPGGFHECGRGAAGSAQPCQGWGRGFESRRPLSFLHPARLAQRESASLTRKRSLVQSQYRAPVHVQPNSSRQCGPGHQTGAALSFRCQAGWSRLAPEIIARRVDSVWDSPIPIAQSRMPSRSQSRNVAVRCPISC